METSIRSIVVAVAALEAEDPLLKTAVELADSVGATLYVVHAFHVPDAALSPYPEMSYFSPEILTEVREDMDRRLAAHVRQFTDSDRVVTRVVASTAELAVLDTAREVGADLIVTGATRRGKLGRVLLGTTSQRVIRAAEAPVLMVHGESRREPRRVLFTTDLTEMSITAHRAGLALVRTFAGDAALEMRCLLVADYDVHLPPPLGDSAVAEIAGPKLNEFLRRVSPDKPIEGRVRVGHPPDEIIAEAEEWDADLLVLGTHGRTGASRFLIGSVAESVVRDAPCDVLVIPNLVIETAEVADV